MKASALSFRVAVLFVIAGMVWGIIMAITENHATLPAHAHLNLLGWVSLFLFGIFYHLHPALDRSRMAMIQVCIWIAGTLVMTVGVGLIYSGHPAGDPVAGIGSFVALAGMVLFARLVFFRQPANAVAS